MSAIILTTNAGVTIVEMNRPKVLKALNPQMIDERTGVPRSHCSFS